MSVAATSGLWVDRIPTRLRLTRLADRFTGRPELGAYLFVVIAAGLDAALSFVVAWRTGSPTPLTTNPFWLLLPVIVLFLVWANRTLTARYDGIREQIDLESRTGAGYGPETFQPFVPRRVRAGLYGLAVVLHAGTILYRGAIPELVSTLGPLVAVLKFGIIIPGAYLPIGAEFAAIMVAIHVRLPRLVRRSDLAMDFSDPTDFGGMYQFGALVKYSYYLFAGVLLLLLVWTYAEELFSTFVGRAYDSQGIETPIQFGVMWVVGTGLLAHSVIQYHVHMARAKEAKLQEITERIRELTDEGATVPDVQPGPEEVERIRLEYDNLRWVRRIREYPVDFVMVSQLVFSILLPVVLERLFSGLF